MWPFKTSGGNISLWAQTVAAVLIAFTLPSYSVEARDRKAAREFQRENPCPSNGKKRTACPGWIVDHTIPLCAGGADAPRNMQWQTRANAKLKDQEEKRQCAAIRRIVRTELGAS